MDSISPREQALLELSLGRPDAALACLEDEPDPLRVEALVGARRNDDAAEELARLEGVGATPHALALARALVASDFDADFQTALAAAPSAADRAHAQLLYGERLRRARRRADAQAQLQPALEAFERLGATSWTARARRELEAVAQRARRDDADGALTKQEGAVAALVAEGATNKDAAAKLFLSEKTVEYHLRNVYRKLGLRSRAELAARRAGAPEQVERAPQVELFGRDDDLEALRARLRRERLVTITGTGGVGKTAVARVLAAEDGDGTFVDLSAIRDSSSVIWAIAQGLGVREVGGRPLLESVARALAVGPRLVVLDNFEQVLEAKSVVAELLAAAPELRLLVTSRVPLRIAEEAVYELPPLGTPRTAETALERIGASPAVLLFETRARAIEPSFTLMADNAAVIAEICRRLDGIPLAIELAAARVTLLAPEALLTRLDKRLALLTRGRRDLPRRQRTLRATLEWSHELLEPEEQQAFARLAVFVGGFTAESAEAVTGAPLDVLDALLETGLLARASASSGAPRARMLETVREYALEQLAARAEAEAVAKRHSEHFLALIEEMEPSLRAEYLDYRGQSLDRLEPELDNLRAAFECFEASGDSQLALRLAAAAWRLWDKKLHPAEGRARLESALEADSDATAARAHALNGAAVFAFAFADAETAKFRAEEALALHRALGDASGAAEATLFLGVAASDEGDEATARERFEESERLFRELGDELSALVANRLLGGVYRRVGDRERARALVEENLRRARALQSEGQEASTLLALALLSVDEGQVDDAVSMLKTSLRVAHDSGDQDGVAQVVCHFARALALTGRVETAARLLAFSEALHEELGFSLRPYLAAERDSALAAIRKQLDDAAFADAWEQGLSLTMDEAVALALQSAG